MEDDGQNMSMSEWTGCSKFGHRWIPLDGHPGWEECLHCGKETQAVPSAEETS